MQSSRFKRRGITSVLAMMYLVLFSCLALGFYAHVTTAVQVSQNETHSKRAMLSAESGMEFMRYLLGNTDIPASTTPDQIWPTLCSQIKQQLDGTSNIHGATLATPSGEVMTIPTITLDSSGCGFNATLTHSGEKVILQIAGTGPDAQVHRTIQITYARAERASAIFDYGVASKSVISMAGNAKITGAAGASARGSVLTTTTADHPLTMTGGPSISGDFSYTNASGTNSYANGTIGGYNATSSSFASHVHSGVTAPEFPEVDTSAFAPYVPSATAAPGAQVIAADPPSSRTSFTNIRIKANANPHFAAKSVFTGVVYIETPNQVTFSGSATVQGVIVVQNNPTGTTATNTITFNGNVTHQGVETLPDSGAFAGLPKLTGSFLLAPKFDVVMQGNNNQVGGTIVTGKLDISGNAGANVSGTVINLEDTGVSLTGSSDIIISSTGTTNYPTGVVFGNHYAPLADTYQELQ
jgi:Tfp pilus assembly protein PilX